VDYYSALEEFALEEVAEELTEELSSIEGVYGVSIGTNLSGVNLPTPFIEVEITPEGYVETTEEREELAERVKSVIESFEREYDWVKFSYTINGGSPEVFVNESNDERIQRIGILNFKRRLKWKN